MSFNIFFETVLDLGIFSYKISELNSNCLFTPRDGINLVVWNNKLRLMNGWNQDVFHPLPSTNQIWESSDANTWNQLANANWAVRHANGYGIKNDKIWIFGGDTFATGFFQKDVWTYDNTNGYVQITPDWGNPLGDRGLFAFCVVENWFYIIGGQNSNFNSPTNYNDVIRTKDFLTFETVGTMPNQYCSTGQSVYRNGVMYYVGGGRYLNSGHDHFNFNMYKSADLGVTWELVGKLPDAFNGTMYCNACVWDGKIWVMNGANAGFPFNQPGLFYWNGTVWNQLYSNPTARHASSMAVYNDKMYVVAGNMWNDSWVIEKVPFKLGVINYLIVAGGGGGGGAATDAGGGGGGGAGGMLTVNNFAIGIGIYPIVVGGGGSNGVPGSDGSIGGDSSFSGFTAIGGGGGRAAGNTGNGISGGSGGGVSWSGGSSVIGGSSMAAQGNKGGDSVNNGGNIPGTGGGGAGTVGGNVANVTNATAGVGGDGLSSSISGSPVIYAAGGGGGRFTFPPGGGGGLGGSGGVGGTGGSSPGNGTSGNINTGSGGGGGGSSSTGQGYGGAGTDGIVIISYASGTITATGGTITNVGGNTIHTFTSNGNFVIDVVN